MSKNNNTLVGQVKAGNGVVAKVWRYQNGKKVSFSVTVEKNKKDKETQEWKTYHQFYEEEVLRASHAMNEAFKILQQVKEVEQQASAEVPKSQDS